MSCEHNGGFGASSSCPQCVAALAAIVPPQPPRFGISYTAQRAKALGLRVVPDNPSPHLFPVIPYACDVRPARCADCTCSCPYGVDRNLL